MLKLYGFAASNYFNMIKLALLEKQLPFEMIPLHGCQNPEILAISARGKVPVLQTAQGFISETDVILSYLEEVYPAHGLVPADPFERAQVWTLAKEIELYIELPARICYVEVFFGGRPTPQALKDKAQRDLIKGFAALKQRARFAPLSRARFLPWRICTFCTAPTWPGQWANSCLIRIFCKICPALGHCLHVWRKILTCNASPSTRTPSFRRFWRGSGRNKYYPLERGLCGSELAREEVQAFKASVNAWPSQASLLPQAELLTRRQQRLTAYHGRLDLRRCGAADVVTGVDRTLQRQHGKYILLNLNAEFAQLFQAHFS
jgi:glutathione S-transferase